MGSMPVGRTSDCCRSGGLVSHLGLLADARGLYHRHVVGTNRNDNAYFW